jgi:glycosyltransferase involved in cell wall biosynthesis
MVSRWYPSSDEPMSGIFVARQAGALRRETTVHVLVPVAAPFRDVLRFVIFRGPLCGDVPVPVPALPAFGAIVRTLIFFRALNRLHPRPDVVHLHELLPEGCPLVIASRLRRMPLIITEHSNLLAQLVTSTRARLQLRLAVRGAAAVTTSSHWVADQISAFFPKAKPFAVGIPIDTELFHPAESPSRDFAIAVAVKLGEPKGTDVLLEAWSLVPSAPPLMLVGGDTRRWEERAAALGISERCSFLGELPEDTTAQLLRNARFLVSASRGETFAAVVAEAIVSGTPVISTSVGEPAIYVTREVGLLVPPGDATSLARAVADLAERAGEFDPAALRRHIASRYGQDNFAKRMMATYSLLLDQC